MDLFSVSESSQIQLIMLFWVFLVVEPGFSRSSAHYSFLGSLHWLSQVICENPFSRLRQIKFVAEECVLAVFSDCYLYFLGWRLSVPFKVWNLWCSVFPFVKWLFLKHDQALFIDSCYFLIPAISLDTCWPHSEDHLCERRYVFHTLCMLLIEREAWNVSRNSAVLGGSFCSMLLNSCHLLSNSSNYPVKKCKKTNCLFDCSMKRNQA